MAIHPFNLKIIQYMPAVIWFHSVCALLSYMLAFKMDHLSTQITSVDTQITMRYCCRHISTLQHKVLRHLCTLIVHTDVRKKTSNPTSKSKTNITSLSEIEPIPKHKPVPRDSHSNGILPVFLVRPMRCVEPNISTIESLRHHLSVHDGDVDQEEQDDQEVIHEAQQAEEGLWQEVERGHQVGEGAHQTQQDPDAEHPEQAAHGEELPKGVAQQGGYVSQAVHQRSGLS